MRTTPALRTLAAVLLTGGTLAVAAAGTTAAAAPPTSAEGRGSGMQDLRLRPSADPLPQRASSPQWSDAAWTDRADPVGNDSWSVSVSAAFSFSVSLSVGTSGTSSSGWEWIPLAR
ncbi:hypothetical protein ABZ614_44605 [Streptomyces sp. NPDC013178]|uniref:hypothetical protein n=1 Tax=unclassified Streptomyces TaxID=2593676 RepID=UPI00341018E0